MRSNIEPESGSKKSTSPTMCILTPSDIKTLIEILLAHNSSNLKYWIPRKVQSILNNEEVSAYLLAYLNTQDMLESPREFKGKRKSIFKNSRFATTEKLVNVADDYNFDVFDFDRDLLHVDTMVNAVNSIYRKFG